MLSMSEEVHCKSCKDVHSAVLNLQGFMASWFKVFHETSERQAHFLETLVDLFRKQADLNDAVLSATSGTTVRTTSFNRVSPDTNVMIESTHESSRLRSPSLSLLQQKPKRKYRLPELLPKLDDTPIAHLRPASSAIGPSESSIAACHRNSLAIINEGNVISRSGSGNSESPGPFWNHATEEGIEIPLGSASITCSDDAACAGWSILNSSSTSSLQRQSRHCSTFIQDKGSSFPGRSAVVSPNVMPALSANGDGRSVSSNSFKFHPCSPSPPATSTGLHNDLLLTAALAGEFGCRADAFGGRSRLDVAEERSCSVDLLDQQIMSPICSTLPGQDVIPVRSNDIDIRSMESLLKSDGLPLPSVVGMATTSSNHQRQRSVFRYPTRIVPLKDVRMHSSNSGKGICYIMGDFVYLINKRFKDRCDLYLRCREAKRQCSASALLTLRHCKIMGAPHNHPPSPEVVKLNMIASNLKGGPSNPGKSEVPRWNSSGTFNVFDLGVKEGDLGIQGQVGLDDGDSCISGYNQNSGIGMEEEEEIERAVAQRLSDGESGSNHHPYQDVIASLSLCCGDEGDAEPDQVDGTEPDVELLNGSEMGAGGDDDGGGAVENPDEIDDEGPAPDDNPGMHLSLMAD